ncbi:hypothetical protein [Comamonas sp. NoAH]|nr:hypothetical protein [Comamonas sp. NoAH]
MITLPQVLMVKPAKLRQVLVLRIGASLQGGGHHGVSACVVF